MKRLLGRTLSALRRLQALTREGQSYAEPQEVIAGPKAMIINEFAGSGGDALPWFFRNAQIGSLVGTRTWGGLVGIRNYPQLMTRALIGLKAAVCPFGPPLPT